MLNLTPEPSAADLLFLEVDRRLGSTRNLPLDQLVALLGTQLVLRPHPLVALAIAAIMEAYPNQSSTASPITSDICENTCEKDEGSSGALGILVKQAPLLAAEGECASCDRRRRLLREAKRRSRAKG